MLVPAFDRFPEEGRSIGRLIASYTDLEVLMFYCVRHALGDFDKALKAIWAIRGEQARITAAEKLAAGAFAGQNLGKEFDNAIVAMHACRDFRNNYAHAVWHDFGGRLAFADIEALAKAQQPVFDLTAVALRYVDLGLLDAQHRYFKYAHDLLTHLSIEWQIRSGSILGPQPYPLPLAINPPAQHL